MLRIVSAECFSKAPGRKLYFHRCLVYSTTKAHLTACHLNKIIKTEIYPRISVYAPKNHVLYRCHDPADSQQRSLSTSRREILATIPNILTAGRLAITPAIGYFIVNGQLQLALGTLFFAGFTDYLDGYIARKYPSQRTVIGGVIDPIADKVLITVVTAALGCAGCVPVWLAGLIIGRDACLIGVSLYIRHVSLRAHFDTVTWARYWDFGYPTVVVTPSSISKWNTALQVFTLLVSLGAPAVGGAMIPVEALYGLWGLTAATTFTSGANYMLSNNALVFLQPPPGKRSLLHRWPQWALKRLEKKAE
eukprot:m.191431 g.191431  ORF g.191431 m.191431 type:complete len:306 (+) comp18592_c0_seq1:308-1225(+)